MLINYSTKMFIQRKWPAWQAVEEELVFPLSLPFESQLRKLDTAGAFIFRRRTPEKQITENLLNTTLPQLCVETI